jgi:transcriptional regulator with PAS, ATPase and Fis domain
VDCGAIPENLLESELFGYERGAFTGAAARSIGLLEFADRGTFFMDEVGELPAQLQAKLLRALQERRIRRLGGKAEIPVDVRVIAATGRDLTQEVEQGRFRQDLFYRINVVTIPLPPLRERGEDLQLLVQHFLHRHAAEMGKPQVAGLAPEALEVLLSYRWPGNVRELQNVIRRGIAMCRGERVGVDDLPEHLVVSAGEGGEPSVAAAAALARPGAGGGFFQMRAQRMAAFEKEYLTALLRAHHGDVAAAAREAKVPRGTYYRLLKNHDVKPSEYREA